MWRNGMHWIKEKISEKWKYMTLQQKLTGLFISTSIVILAVNLVMYGIINETTRQVENVYVSNVTLNELSDMLDDVHEHMEEYLNTKSSDSMEAYYRSEQDYRELMDRLNVKVIDNDMLLMEKNIYHLSKSYLELTAEVIQAGGL